MTIFFKYITLPILLVFAIYFSSTDATTLRSIYQNVGVIFNIPWMSSGENSIVISDVGHGVIYFMITLISLACFRQYLKITIGLILALIAANEVAQFFILSRQSSWHDFGYGVAGIIAAVTVYFSLLKSMPLLQRSAQWRAEEIALEGSLFL